MRGGMGAKMSRDDTDGTTLDVGGSFTCRPEHVDVCISICDQLGGGLSTNPDGSVTCSFTLPTPGSPTTGSGGSFTCGPEHAAICRAVCNQLGGTLDRNPDHSTTCRFFLPQVPQWSIVPITDDAVRVQFDADMFYIFSVGVEGTFLRAFNNGRISEEVSGVIARADHKVSVFQTGSDGANALMAISGEANCLVTRYSFNGKKIFEIQSPSTSHGPLLARKLRENKDCQPEVRYSKLFIDRLVSQPQFMQQLQILTGTPARSEGNAVETVCKVACVACGLTGTIAACFGWAICILNKPPSGS
jgi:hypothetical protein